MLNQQIRNFGGVLVGHQTAGNLGVGLARQNRFQPFPLESAVEAVDFERRPGPGALVGGKPRFPKD
jgi:hypothetical protein